MWETWRNKRKSLCFNTPNTSFLLIELINMNFYLIEALIFSRRTPRMMLSPPMRCIEIVEWIITLGIGQNVWIIFTINKERKKTSRKSKFKQKIRYFFFWIKKRKKCLTPSAFSILESRFIKRCVKIWSSVFVIRHPSFQNNFFVKGLAQIAGDLKYIN